MASAPYLRDRSTGYIYPYHPETAKLAGMEEYNGPIRIEQPKQRDEPSKLVNAPVFMTSATNSYKEAAMLINGAPPTDNAPAAPAEVAPKNKGGRPRKDKTVATQSTVEAGPEDEATL